MEYTFYKIYCKDVAVTDFYIGSTIDFKQRKRSHKFNCCNENGSGYNFKVYYVIREHGGWTNWNMECIENKTFDCDKDARIYENELINNLGATLNINNAFIDKKEYMREYDALHREQKKEYRVLHREQKKKYQREYRAKKKNQQSQSESSSSS